MLAAALHGDLAKVTYAKEPAFGLAVPQACPGVPSEILNPRAAWPDPADYDAQARGLAEMFQSNLASGSPQELVEG
jgi:phosphoenolpyruvate carboxykinase (ATP)